LTDYRHHVSGFFAHAEQAESVQIWLIKRGLPRERVHLFDAGKAAVTQAGGEATLKEVLVDGAVGSVVGAGVGGLADIVLVAANVSLFIAGPLVAPLVLLGWGAGLGGLIGAITSTGSADAPGQPAGAADTSGSRAGKDGKFATLIADAIASGHAVLVAETLSEQETVIARQIIETLVGEYRDMSQA